MWNIVEPNFCDFQAEVFHSLDMFVFFFNAAFQEGNIYRARGNVDELVHFQDSKTSHFRVPNDLTYIHMDPYGIYIYVHIQYIYR